MFKKFIFVIVLLYPFLTLAQEDARQRALKISEKCPPEIWSLISKYIPCDNLFLNQLSRIILLPKSIYHGIVCNFLKKKNEICIERDSLDTILEKHFQIFVGDEDSKKKWQKIIKTSFKSILWLTSFSLTLELEEPWENQIILDFLSKITKRTKITDAMYEEIHLLQENYKKLISRERATNESAIYGRYKHYSAKKVISDNLKIYQLLPSQEVFQETIIYMCFCFGLSVLIMILQPYEAHSTKMIILLVYSCWVAICISLNESLSAYEYAESLLAADKDIHYYKKLKKLQSLLEKIQIHPGK